jgi:hypothetical protein
MGPDCAKCGRVAHCLPDYSLVGFIMHISLRITDPSTSFAMQFYDAELDDVRSIFSDICQFIDRNGEFIVSGFGQERWPVDVVTDLPVLLEQMPSIVSAMRDGKATELDFYEQGIERSISFSPSSSGYLATCTSQTDWHQMQQPSWSMHLHS